MRAETSSFQDCLPKVAAIDCSLGERAHGRGVGRRRRIGRCLVSSFDREMDAVAQAAERLVVTIFLPVYRSWCNPVLVVRGERSWGNVPGFLEIPAQLDEQPVEVEVLDFPHATS